MPALLVLALVGCSSAPPKPEFRADTPYSKVIQTTCVDNRDGTSTVFATATRETSRLQRVPQSVSAGVSIATVTLPAGNEKVLRPVRRETIQDPKFYQGFYALVEKFSSQEVAARKANSSTGASRDEGGRR